MKVRIPLSVLFACGLVIAIIGHPRWGRCESDGNRNLAKTLVQEATLAYERKDYSKAQQLLEAAYRLYRTDKIQYSLGRVHEAQRHHVEAIAAYGQFLDGVPIVERQRGQTEDAQGAVRRLAAYLGRIHIKGEPGTWFVLDAGEKRYLPLDAFYVEPGAHRITHQTINPINPAIGAAPSGTDKNAPTLIEINVSSGELVHINLHSRIPIVAGEKPPKPVPELTVEPHPAALSRWQHVRVLGFVGLPVAATLVLTGAVLFGLNGTQRCELPMGVVQCPERFDTDGSGLGLLTIGVGVGLGSGLLFGLERKN